MCLPQQNQSCAKSDVKNNLWWFWQLRSTRTPNHWRQEEFQVLSEGGKSWQVHFIRKCVFKLCKPWKRLDYFRKTKQRLDKSENNRRLERWQSETFISTLMEEGIKTILHKSIYLPYTEDCKFLQLKDWYCRRIDFALCRQQCHSFTFEKPKILSDEISSSTLQWFSTLLQV